MGRLSRVATTVGLLGVLGYMAFKLFSGMPFYNNNSGLSERLINRPTITETEHGQRKKYAVVINGDSSPLHQGNVAEAYQSLKYLKFVDEDIFLLTSNKLRTDDGMSITCDATESNLRSVFDYLERVVDDNDLILIYTTGHGGRNQGRSTLTLADNKIFVSKLMAMAAKIKARDYVIFSDQCYSGDINNFLSGLKGSVASFSSIDTENKTDCKSFSRPFWRSFRTGEADVNSDRTTTLDEAFHYAARMHYFSLYHRKKHQNLTNGDCQEYRTKKSPDLLN